MKKPTNLELDKLNMEVVLSNVPQNDTNFKYLNAPSGEEHYRLLSWLGAKVKDQIVELGTFRGHSALCLGTGGKQVHSWDIEDQLSIIQKPDNVHFHIDELGYLAVGEKTSLIFIDTMHDGVFEKQVLDYLRMIEWQGVVVMDDIILFPALADLWASIPEKKEDWSDVGHHSGTGVIFFE